MQRTFSERNRLSPIPPQFIKNEISRKIRNQLADLFIQGIIENTYAGKLIENGESFCRAIHVEYFVDPAHNFRPYPAKNWKDKISDFLLKAPYNEVLDLLEFCLGLASEFPLPQEAVEKYFSEGHSAYRLLDNQFILISSEEEIKTIEKAHSDMESADLIGSKSHLLQAAKLLRNGDWADSIRESIHAVESVANKISGDKTLGKALSKIEIKHPLHPSLKQGFQKLYGYTSDEGGIRHALFDEERKPTEQEALFMFGSCASFVSYLIGFIED